MNLVRTPRTLVCVPDKPKTKHRSVRVDDADWADLDALAQSMGTDRAKVINAYVQWHLRRPGARLPARPTPQQVAEVVARREGADDRA